MGSLDKVRLLMEALQREHRFSDKGLSVDLGPTGGIAIDRLGHVRGIWHVTDAHYVWTAAGYNEPSYSTDSLLQAVDYSLDVVAQIY